MGKKDRERMSTPTIANAIHRSHQLAKGGILPGGRIKRPRMYTELERLGRQ